jgi:NADH:ubiquinone oxidoreductase subunit 5 (subunit L)/multisubunit Na+/H+ antiporter MnhA subunit
MGRVVFVAFFGAPSGENAAHAHEGGWSMRAPLVVLAVLSVATGLFTGTFAQLHGEHYELHFGTGPALAAGLAIAGIALAYVVYGRGPMTTAPAAITVVSKIADTRAVNRLYEFGFQRVTLVVSDALGWIDRYVVDGMINILGYGTLEAGRRLRPVQTGVAPDYVLAVVAGAVGLAFWAVSR